MAAWVAPHTRAVRLMVPWWRRIRGQYGRWYFSGAAYAGNTVDGGLGSIEKYWEELGSIGRKYCRLYCKQYGVILLTGLKRQRTVPKISQSLSKSPKISHAATHDSAPRRRQPPPPQRTIQRRESGRTPHAATHNFAPRRRQNLAPPHTTPRRESGRTLRRNAQFSAAQAARRKIFYYRTASSSTSKISAASGGIA